MAREYNWLRIPHSTSRRFSRVGKFGDRNLDVVDHRSATSRRSLSSAPIHAARQESDEPAVRDLPAVPWGQLRICRIVREPERKRGILSEDLRPRNTTSVSPFSVPAVS